MSRQSFKLKSGLTLTPTDLNTLTSPQAGDLACDINDDNKIKQYSTTSLTWEELGSGGGGGSPEVNYINNDTAEAGTTGWALYNDGLSSTPIDGTAGAANITLTASAVTPLRGTQSFLITKPVTTNCQGQGVSYDFTVNNADLSSALRITFDYETAGGYADTVSGNIIDSDIRCYVYDITNAQVIQVSQQNVAANAQGHFVGTFQTSATSTSYRLILHVATGNAPAFTMKFDNVVVGPNSIIKGAIVTDPVTKTATSTWSTNCTNTVTYNREGKHLVALFRTTLVGSPGTPGALIYTLPDGLTVDTTYQQVTDQVAVGIGTATDNGTAYPISARAFSATQVIATQMDDVAAGIQYNNNVTQTTPFSFGAGDNVEVRVRLPILGWASNTVLSEDTGNRVVKARVGLSGNQTISSTASTKVQFNSIITDSTAAFNTSTNSFVAPESGFYTISANVACDNLTNGVNQYVYIKKASTAIATESAAVFANFAGFTTTTSLDLVKGETITVETQSSGDIDYIVVAASSFLSVVKQASPQTIIGTYITGSTTAENYIINSNFEQNSASGYSAYLDTASSAVPVDGTGGSPSLVSIAVSSASPLHGTYSGLFTKAAADARGNGFSYDFDIDAGDQSTVLRVAFDYNASTSYADGDMVVYVYDRTNSQLIEVIDRSISATTQGHFLGTFQSNSNSTAYRLIWHVATVNAATYTLKVDNINVSRQTIVKGAIVTDWKTYTAQIDGFVSTSQSVLQYKRTGDSISLRGRFTVTTPQATQFRIYLPTGIVAAGNGTEVKGRLAKAISTANSSKEYSLITGGTLNYFTVSNIEYVPGSAPTSAFNGSDIAANGDTFYVEIENYPIAGWSSNLTLSEDSGNRIVAYRAKKVAGQTIATGPSLTTISFDTLLADTTSGSNGSGFVIPETGYYELNGSIYYPVNATGYRAITLKADSTILSDTYQPGNAAVGQDVDVTCGPVLLTKGQVITISATQTSGGNLSVTAEMGVSKISSPQTVIGTFLTGTTSEQNYVINNSFEQNTTSGYSTYLDAAAAAPVDGVGVATQVSLAVSSTSPLRGTYSGVFTKNAVNAQGQGFAYDFTIDSADQANVLTVSFDYSTSAAYVDTVSGNLIDSDMRLYIYDRTNNVLIESSQQNIAANAQGHYVGTFQSSASSVLYRAIWHVASTNASSYTMKVDNVQVGARKNVKAPVVSDWVSYSPSNSLTNATTTGKYRRVGDTIEVQGQAVFAGAATGGQLVVGLPTGLVMDTTKLTSSGEIILGGAGGVDAGVAWTGGWVGYNTTSSVIIYNKTSTTYQYNAVTPTTPYTIAAGDTHTWEFKAPISGWSSNTVLSEDTGNRVISAKLTRAANQLITTGSPQKIVWASIDRDTAGGYDGTNNRYIVPESGIYAISADATTESVSNSTTVRLYIYLNGIAAKTHLLSSGATLGTGQIHTLNAADTQRLNKGDYLEVFVDQNSGSSANFNTVSLNVFKISSPQTLAGSETVAARYATSAGQSIATSSNTIVDFGTKTTFDTHNAVTTGATWKFTAPLSGKYSISHRIQLSNGGGWNAAEVAEVNLYKNNSVFCATATEYAQATHSNYVTLVATTTIELVKGDFIDLRIIQTSGGSITLYPFASNNWVNIERIGS